MFSIEISTFLGRFHPLIVHFPIGFIFLGILIETYTNIIKLRIHRKVIAFCWMMGLITSIFAVIFGWLLTLNGYYIENQISLHKWSGVFLLFLTFIGWLIKSNILNLFKKQDFFINFLVILTLVIVGHQGANITHGKNYLYEYLPSNINNFFQEKKNVKYYENSEIDSIKIFTDLILPVFENKCIDCHNQNIKSGGLNMLTIKDIKNGGLSGKSIIAGNSSKSLIFQRATLSQDNKKFMPPTGIPLTYDEINLIKWWIDKYLNSDLKLSELKLSGEEKSLLEKLYKINMNPKPYYEKLKDLPKINIDELEVLEKSEFKWNFISDNYELLEIKFTGKKIDDDKILKLKKFSNHIVSLSMTNCKLTNDNLQKISDLYNLVNLDINNNSNISDDGIKFLKNLENLEKINLYGTNVSNLIFENLVEFKKLKKIYLWKTNVTKNEVDKFNLENSDKQIFLGI